MKATPSTSPEIAILRAARSLFAALGFDATSVRTIAEQAGVNPAMIHYYFRSKDGLYRRVLEAEFSAIFRTVMDRVEVGLPAHETLIAVVIGLTDELHKDPQRTGLLRQELGRGGKTSTAVLHDMRPDEMAGFESLVFRLIRAGQNRGRIKRLPPRSIWALLESVAFGSLLLPALPGAELTAALPASEEWEPYLETCELVLRAGLLAEPG